MIPRRSGCEDWTGTVSVVEWVVLGSLRDLLAVGLLRGPRHGYDALSEDDGG